MSPDAQRIAIAQACGITRDSDGRWFDLEGQQVHGAPFDYLNDLNAMHEAEKMLSDAQRTQYYHALGNDREFCRLVKSNILTQPKSVISATAAQRSAAFLETLNLWDYSK